MPTPTKGPRLGGGSSHERIILANLATALFEHGRITTTLAKAKRLRPVAERLVTKAKRGDLHSRRQVHDGRARQDGRARAVHRDRPALRQPARAATPASSSSARARATTLRWRSSSWSSHWPSRSSPRQPGQPRRGAKERATKTAAAAPASKVAELRLSTPRRRQLPKLLRTPKPRATSKAPLSRLPKPTRRRRRPRRSLGRSATTRRPQSPARPIAFEEIADEAAEAAKKAAGTVDEVGPANAEAAATTDGEAAGDDA